MMANLLISHDAEKEAIDVIWSQRMLNGEKINTVYCVGPHAHTSALGDVISAAANGRGLLAPSTTTPQQPLV